jgi:hypothetical protein
MAPREVTDQQRVQRLAGVRRRAVLLDSSVHRVAGRGERIQVAAELDRRQEHVLTEKQCDAAARRGDEGVLTFVADEHAPRGGYWKFAKAS